MMRGILRVPKALGRGALLGVFHHPTQVHLKEMVKKSADYIVKAQIRELAYSDT